MLYTNLTWKEIDIINGQIKDALFQKNIFCVGVVPCYQIELVAVFLLIIIK